MYANAEGNSPISRHPQHVDDGLQNRITLKWLILVPFVFLGTLVVSFMGVVIWWQTDRQIVDQNNVVGAIIQDEMPRDLGIYLASLDRAFHKIGFEIGLFTKTLSLRPDFIKFVEKAQPDLLFSFIKKEVVIHEIDFAMIFRIDGKIISAYPNQASEYLIDQEAENSPSIRRLMELARDTVGDNRIASGLVSFENLLTVALGIADPDNPGQGLLAIASAIMVHDDFGEPLGILIAGRQLRSRNEILQPLTNETGASFALFHRGRPLASSGFVGTLPMLDEATSSSIRQAGKPVLMPGIFGENHFTVCQTPSGLTEDTAVVSCAAFPMDIVFDAKARISEIGTASQNATLFFLSATSAAAIVLFALISILISVRITRPLATMTNIVSRIADDDLDIEIPNFKSSAETVRLGVALQIFRDNALSRRAMEKELQHASKLEAIGRLASGIAHEINTPLQYIGDNLRFLADAHDDLFKVLKTHQTLKVAARTGDGLEPALVAVETEEEEADLDYLLEEIPISTAQSLDGIQQVSHIVEALKDFSHHSDKDKVPVDLNKTIENILTISRSNWKYVAEVETELDTNLPPVTCVGAEIKQVMLNLVVNAAHAVAARGEETAGRIAIASCLADGYAEIRVSDSGTGIPAAVRGKIFDPFFTTKDVGKGTGQGLSISHDIIVNKHQGRLFFETEEGKGTTFIIQLPLEQQAVVTQAAE